MNLHELVSDLIKDTKGSPAGSFLEFTADSSLRAFLPELILCATILLTLLVRVFKIGRLVNAFYIVLPGSLLALYFAASATNVTRMEIFTGMLVYDGLAVYIRSAILLFTVLFVVFTKLTGIPDHDDGPDIYSLVLGATLGMCLMVSANHMLTVFLGVEMASVPSYVLAGLMKGRRKASEAALKYAVYGAGAAGVMLYGISLLAGLLNSAHLPTMAVQLAERFPQMNGSERMVLAFGGLTIAVGLAFKLSAVPFHFWAPDVFEGATAEVGAFLSVASKAAALALLVRVAVGLSAIPPQSESPGDRTAAAATTATSPKMAALYNVASEEVKEAAAPAAEPDKCGAEITAAQARIEASTELAPVRAFTAQLIAFFAALTCTFGNFAAYGQTNIKRLLAYSTIAHAGYMMMPVAAMVALIGINNLAAERALAALGIYIATYLFMNLGAFAVVAFLRNAFRSEEISDYAGLIRRCPVTVVCFALILFSLVGLPPLAGFIGKFAAFAAVADAYRQVQAAGQNGFYLLLLLIIGGLNTAVSLYYYLRIVKVMTIDEESRDRPPFTYSDVSLAGAFLWLLTLPTVGLILNPNWLSEWTIAAAKHLFF